jgi:hypothetical protein
VDGGWIMSAMLKLVKVFLKEKMRKKLLQCTHEELYAKHGFKKEDMPPMVWCCFFVIPCCSMDR